MPAGKRSRAATKGMRPTKITGAQRKARKINIEKARRSKKGGIGKGGAKDPVTDVSTMISSSRSKKRGKPSLKMRGEGSVIGRIKQIKTKKQAMTLQKNLSKGGFTGAAAHVATWAYRRKF